MRVRRRLGVTILLLAGAMPAAADVPDCRRAGPSTLAAGAERALARADWPLAARLYRCAASDSRPCAT